MPRSLPRKSCAARGSIAVRWSRPVRPRACTPSSVRPPRRCAEVENPNSINAARSSASAPAANRWPPSHANWASHAKRCTKRSSEGRCRAVRSSVVSVGRRWLPPAVRPACPSCCAGAVWPGFHTSALRSDWLRCGTRRDSRRRHWRKRPGLSSARSASSNWAGMSLGPSRTRGSLLSWNIARRPGPDCAPANQVLRT